VVKKGLAALVEVGIPVMHENLLLQIKEEIGCASGKVGGGGGVFSGRDLLHYRAHSERLMLHN